MVVEVDETNGGGFMGMAIFDMSMSLDGFMRGANPRPEEPMGDSGQRLHEWAFGNGALDLDLAGTGWALGALGAGILGGLGTVLSGRPVAREHTGPIQPHAA